MFKTVAEDVWVFDIEWVPDPVTGRRVHELPDDLPDADVVDHMFMMAGATEDDPRPFLKTVLCRIVSISVLARTATRSHPVRLELWSLPAVGEVALDETTLISRFLEAVGKTKPDANAQALDKARQLAQGMQSLGERMRGQQGQSPDQIATFVTTLKAATKALRN